MKILPVIINIFLSVMVINISGCGKKIEAGSPEEVLSLLREKGGTSEVMQLYTDDTVGALKKYMKLTGMSEETATDVLGFIPSDSEYEVVSEKVEGERAFLRLRFTKHSKENLAGYVVDVNMTKDGKTWKIDREKDFKTLISAYEKGGAENYLKKIR